jgi:hypothetical protein
MNKIKSYVNKLFEKPKENEGEYKQEFTYSPSFQMKFTKLKNSFNNKNHDIENVPYSPRNSHRTYNNSLGRETI